MAHGVDVLKLNNYSTLFEFNETIFLRSARTIVKLNLAAFYYNHVKVLPATLNSVFLIHNLVNNFPHCKAGRDRERGQGSDI